jgi:hypothetical protein
MSLRDILDFSIVEEPSAFPDIDELIARERRRLRRRHWAAATAGTVGVVGPCSAARWSPGTSAAPVRRST